MFFILSKLVRIFLDPVFLYFLIFCVVYLLCRKRITKIAQVFICLGLGLIYISGSPIFSGYLLYRLENSVESVKNLGKYDYIVLPSGFVDVSQPGDDIPVFGGGVERLLYAVKFLKEKHARVIIFTGGNGSLDRSLPGEAAINAEFSKKYMKVRPSEMLIENLSANSRENALFTAELLKKEPTAKVLLVTSAFHMPRMSLSLKKVGIQFDTFSVDYRVGKKFNISNPLDYFPSVSGVAALSTVVNEVVGLIAYKFMGYI